MSKRPDERPSSVEYTPQSNTITALWIGSHVLRRVL